VKCLKGDSRPLFTQEDRKFILENLECVDEVIIFDEDTPYNLIKKLQPNEIVKGGDYKVEDIAGHDIAEVVLFPYNKNNSTTKSLAKLGYS
jgi:D-beta-D-heptose 7-phosphate kinase/D-beta-D-heptose 1-phosphate adenosyltransferase|tara:strand:+ start:297 stop:569 length:273 start_codon:yes stop_codon:yes gene_type:complete